MTRKLGDFIRQTTETIGVGSIALIDPEPPYFGFVDVLGDGASVFYVVSSGLDQVEGGWGTLAAGAPDQIGRTAANVVFGSSGPGVLVDFNAGIKTVVAALGSSNLVWSPDGVTVQIGNSVGNFRSAFIARLSAPVANVTGDGTAYTVAFDTKDSDVGNNFAANAYTARVAGVHDFRVSVHLQGLTAGHTYGDLAFITSSGQVASLEYDNFGARRDASSNELTLNGSALLKLASGETVTVRLRVFNGTKVVGVYGAAAAFTTFAGALVQ